MGKLSPQKRRFWFYTMIIALALLVCLIVFKDEFSEFLNFMNSKLSVLNSLIIGAVIAYLINPVEKFFGRVYRKVKNYKTQRFLSIFSAYFFVIGIITLFIIISVPQLVRSVNELPVKLQEFLTIVTTHVKSWYDDFIISDFYKSIVEYTGKELDVNELLDSLMETSLNIDKLLNDITTYVIILVGKLYTGVTDGIVGLVLSIYLIASKDKLKAQAKKITTAIVGTERMDGVLEVVRYTDHAFGGFIQGKLINAVIITILTLIAFMIFGIPYPQLLALIIGVTDIIPIFGPFIGAIPSAFVVLIAAPEKLIPMLLIILIIQQIDGNYIGPKILGESTGLSSLGVFVAIIVMGGYFGLIGMLIGVPTFAVAQYLITKAVDKRLAEKGVSTDIEDYYSDSMAGNYERTAIHQNLFTKIVDPMIRFVKIAVMGIVNFIKKLPKIRKKTSTNTNKKTKIVKKSKLQISESESTSEDNNEQNTNND